MVKETVEHYWAARHMGAPSVVTFVNSGAEEEEKEAMEATDLIRMELEDYLEPQDMER